MEEHSSSDESREGSPEPKPKPKSGPVVKLKSKKEEYKSYMEDLRKREGMDLPLRMEMERSLCRKMGNKVMEDVLTGRYDTIGFEDLVQRPERSEKQFLPRSKGEKLFNPRRKP